MRKKKEPLDPKEAAKKIIADYLRDRPDHKPPVTRRDFLRVGVIHSMGYMMAPSLLSVFSRLNVAHAAGCSQTVAETVPFITVNFAGGWGLTSHWAPSDAGGNPLNDYSKFAQGTSPSFRNVFGNNVRFFNNQGQAVAGKFLEGIFSATPAGVTNKASFVGIPTRSSNDTDDNPMDITALLMKAGAAGTQLPNMGTRSSRTGINHKSAFQLTPPSPMIVKSVDNITSALSFGGALDLLNADQKVQLAKSIENLSTSQARSLASLSGGENLMDLVSCATGMNAANIQQNVSAQVDPRNNSSVANVWGITTNTRASETDARHAAMVYNCLNGTSGPIGIDLGGYDYHANDDRSDVDRKDLAAGVLVGRILATANAMNKKVFVALVSDGSVYAKGTAQGDPFAGDSSDTAALAFLAFDPAGAPATSGSQIGQFDAKTLSVDSSFITGSGEIAAAAIFLNWAKYSGRLNEALKAFPRQVFTTQQLDAILKVA